MGRPPECNTCCDITVDPPVSDCEFLVAIAFLDENSGPQGKERETNPLTGNTYFFDKYAKYLEAFPNRLVFVLDVFRAGDTIYYPPNFLDSNKAFSLKAEFEKDATNLIQSIQKDNNSDAIADSNDPWGRVVEIASRYPEAQELLNNATEISIFADDSGSMKESQIAATLRKLKADIAAAGKRSVGSIANGNEDVMCPFVLEKCCTGAATTELAALCFATTEDDRYLYTCCPDDLVLASPLATEQVLIRNYCNTTFEEDSVYYNVCPECTTNSNTSFVFQFNLIDDKGNTLSGDLKFYYQYFDATDATWKDLNVGTAQDGFSGQPFSLNLVIDQWGGSSSTETPCHEFLENTNGCDTFTDGEAQTNGCRTRTFDQLFRIKAEYTGDEECDPQNYTQFSEAFQLYEWRGPVEVSPDSWVLLRDSGDCSSDSRGDLRDPTNPSDDIPPNSLPNWGPNNPWKGYPLDELLNEFVPQSRLNETHDWDAPYKAPILFTDFLPIPTFFTSGGGSSMLGVKWTSIITDLDGDGVVDYDYEKWFCKYSTFELREGPRGFGAGSFNGLGCWKSIIASAASCVECGDQQSIPLYEDAIFRETLAQYGGLNSLAYGDIPQLYLNKTNYLIGSSAIGGIFNYYTAHKVRLGDDDRNIGCDVFTYVADPDETYPPNEEVRYLTPKVPLWIRKHSNGGTHIDYPIFPNTIPISDPFSFGGDPDTLLSKGFTGFVNKDFCIMPTPPCFDGDYVSVVGQSTLGAQGQVLIGLFAKYVVTPETGGQEMGSNSFNELFGGVHFIGSVDNTAGGTFTQVITATPYFAQTGTNTNSLSYSVLGFSSQQAPNGIFQQRLAVIDTGPVGCEYDGLLRQFILQSIDPYPQGVDPDSTNMIGFPLNERSAISTSTRVSGDIKFLQWHIVSKGYDHWTVDTQDFANSKTRTIAGDAVFGIVRSSNDFDTNDERFSPAGEPILLSSRGYVNSQGAFRSQSTWAQFWLKEEEEDSNGFVTKYSVYVKIFKLSSTVDVDEPYYVEYPSFIAKTIEFPPLSSSAEDYCCDDTAFQNSGQCFDLWLSWFNRAKIVSEIVNYQLVWDESSNSDGSRISIVWFDKEFDPCTSLQASQTYYKNTVQVDTWIHRSL